MDIGDLIEILILILLVVLSGLFSSAETSMTTCNRMRIRTLADNGDKRAKTLLGIVENQNAKMLSAILIGNNIVNLTASSIATSLAYGFGGYGIGIVTGILTFVILVLGEITPKTLATIHSDKMALAYTPFIRVFMTIMTPFIAIINGVSLGLLLLLRIDPNARDDSMTEEELRTIVDVSHEDGVIESEEKKMIYNVFDLGDAKAKDVMVPRVHVTFADVECSYDELIDIFKEDKFTRLPIYEDTTDNVIGTINIKDLLLYDDKESFHIRDILREAYFTYEYKNISELLVEMRDASLNIAIVLDEYGETSGIITLEDLLEEIVGEIHDEYDEDEDAFVEEVKPNEYMIEGSTNLDDLNETIGSHLESEDYDSLGGYIIDQLDRFPEVGDEITTEDGIRMVVETLDKNRVERVHVYLPDGYNEEPEDE